MGVITGSRTSRRYADNNSPSLVIAQLTGRIVHANDAAVAMLESPIEELVGVDIREFFSVEIPPAGGSGPAVTSFKGNGNWINRAPSRFSHGKRDFELSWRPLQLGWMSYWVVTCTESVSNVSDPVNEKLLKGLGKELGNTFMLPEASSEVETHWKHISFHKPTTGVGGDLLVMEEISRDHLFYFIGNVAGHHRSADVVRMMVMSYLRVYSSEADLSQPGKFPGTLLNKLNVAMCQDERNDSLLTGMVLLLEKNGKRAYFASAGHQPVYLVESGAGHTRISTEDIPLGIKPGIRYTTMDLSINPGDRLVCYTDGLISTGPSIGFKSGHDSLGEILKTCSRTSGDNLAGCLEKLWNRVDVNKTEIKTDITFTVIDMDREIGSRAVAGTN